MTDQEQPAGLTRRDIVGRSLLTQGESHMSQPVWKCVAQLGDASPIDYGGYWVFVDETGAYPPEGEYLLCPDGDEEDWETPAKAFIEGMSKPELIEYCGKHDLFADCESQVPFSDTDDIDTIRQSVMDNAGEDWEEFCEQNSIPSNQPEEYEAFRFTLDKCTFIDGVLSDNRFHPEQRAWWADDLSDVCGCMDVELDELRRLFCSDDAVERAQAYRMIGEYHGLINLDSYRLQMTRREAESRYDDPKYAID